MQHKLFTLHSSLFTFLVIAFAACNNNEPSVTNYYVNDNPAVVSGQLKGKFSVSASKKISFSQGNLQYNAALDKWRFAENQYDIVGDDSKGTVKIGTVKCSNTKISNTYNGWIDLFGWGTGMNPTNTSSNDADYPKFSDWGQNMIYNGGNKVDLWRTLTREEWIYLFYGRKDADSKFATGHIILKSSPKDSINGTFLLPDNWTKPKGINFTPSKEKGLVLGQNGYYDNEKKNNFSHNRFTLSEWEELEKSGVVFLPATGYREGTAVANITSDIDGNYWSADYSSPSYAYYIYFYNRSLGAKGAINRFYGQGVRLVR
jgi:hypothetical protein